jgi:hypothetical protein
MLFMAAWRQHVILAFQYLGGYAVALWYELSLRLAFLLWNANTQLLANFSGQDEIDFGTSGDSCGTAVKCVYEYRVFGPFSMKNAALANQMFDQLLAFQNTILGSLSFS